MSDKKIALVTGANKGIGFEIARQLGRQGVTVLLGARDEKRGTEAAGKLRAEGLDVQTIQLDLTNPDSIAAAAKKIAAEFGRLDILVNNAGVALESLVTQPSEIDLQSLRATFEANVLGTWNVTQAMLPLIKKSPSGRIVNLSSTMGSLTEIGDRTSHYDGAIAPGYRASKTAVNALTALFAKELRDTKIKVNSACPGWVATDMGSAAAPLTVEQGADTPVWLALLPDDGPSGGFFRERQAIAW